MLGVFNILKPTGWTSSDVVVKVKHLLREYTGDKKIKVGHLGTLDPAGSGVLPVCFGKATRLFDYYSNCDKVYRTTFTFGKTTDTLDSYGNIIGSSDIIPTLSQIEDKIKLFVGDIMQLPPKYSRISVGGIRSCDAVRSGQEIEIKPRKVSVYSINILSYENGVLALDIHCSGGTYIRSICRDLGELLDCYAYMSSIIRLRNKGFDIDNAITLDTLVSDIKGNIITIDKLLEDMQSVELDIFQQKKLLNGVPVKSLGIKGDYIVKINGQIFGICSDTNDKIEVKVRLWN